MQTNVQTARNVTVPPDLQSPQAKLIYFSLAACDDVTVDDICQDLNVDKGTVLSILGTLRERGHVERLDGSYTITRN